MAKRKPGRPSEVWKVGEIRKYSTYARDYTIEARCIEKDNLKINRIDPYCVLFHTSSSAEFRSYLRNLIKEKNLRYEGFDG